MIVLTFGTEEAKLKRLMESAGFHIENLGVGLEFTGLMQKVHRVNRFLRDVSGDEEVLFVDGYDVVFSERDCWQGIKERFRASGAEVLVSAERNCYPYPIEAEYPACHTPYRFVNSGCYIGYCGALRRLFADMRVERIPAYVNDQAVFTDFYLFRGGFVLDHEANLFQSLFAAEGDLRRDGEGYINTVTGSRPLILHGNGGVDMDNFLNRGE